MVMAAVDTIPAMGSKSLTAEQNQRARDLVRALVLERYGDKKVTAAKAFGVSQPMLSEFLAGNKGLGAKLLSGISRRDPDVAARILGSSHVAVLHTQPETAPTESEGGAISPQTREEAIELLTDGGYPYRNVKAALSGVAAYELEREGRSAEIGPAHVARLARGLLDSDRSALSSSAPDMGRARARLLGKSKKLPKRPDRLRKGRTGK